MQGDVSEETGQVRMSTSHLLLLVTALLFVPSIFLIQGSSFTDAHYTTVSIAAPLWAYVHSYGSNYGGPFDTTILSVSDLSQLDTVGVLVMSVFLFLRVRLFATNGQRRTFLTDICVTALALIVYSSFFSYSLDGFALSSGITIPLMPVLGSIIVYYSYKRR